MADPAYELRHRAAAAAELGPGRRPVLFNGYGNDWQLVRGAGWVGAAGQRAPAGGQQWAAGQRRAASRLRGCRLARRPQLHRDAADALVGTCTGECRSLLDHTVSVHTHGRAMSDYAAARAPLSRFLHTMALLTAAGEPLSALAAGLRP